VWTVQNTRHLVEGTNHVKIYTDHKSAEDILTSTSLKRMLQFIKTDVFASSRQYLDCPSQKVQKSAIQRRHIRNILGYTIWMMLNCGHRIRRSISRLLLLRARTKSHLEIQLTVWPVRHWQVPLCNMSWMILDTNSVPKIALSWSFNKGLKATEY